jgi:hypothetical protein
MLLIEASHLLGYYRVVGVLLSSLVDSAFAVFGRFQVFDGVDWRSRPRVIGVIFKCDHKALLVVRQRTSLIHLKWTSKM